MEAGNGLWTRVAERVLSATLLLLLLGSGIALWRMPAETRAALWSGLWRTALWLLIAGALPWSASLFMSRLLEIGSNWASVALLTTLLLVDALCGVGLMTAWPAGVWSWLAALGLLAAAATYNYLVAEYLAERVGG